MLKRATVVTTKQSKQLNCFCRWWEWTQVWVLEPEYWDRAREDPLTNNTPQDFIMIPAIYQMGDKLPKSTTGGHDVKIWISYTEELNNSDHLNPILYIWIIFPMKCWSEATSNPLWLSELHQVREVVCKQSCRLYSDFLTPVFVAYRILQVTNPTSTARGERGRVWSWT